MPMAFLQRDRRTLVDPIGLGHGVEADQVAREGGNRLQDRDGRYRQAGRPCDAPETRTNRLEGDVVARLWQRADITVDPEGRAWRDVPQNQRCVEHGRGRGGRGADGQKKGDDDLAHLGLLLAQSDAGLELMRAEP